MTRTPLDNHHGISHVGGAHTRDAPYSSHRAPFWNSFQLRSFDRSASVSSSFPFRPSLGGSPFLRRSRTPHDSGRMSAALASWPFAMHDSFIHPTVGRGAIATTPCPSLPAEHCPKWITVMMSPARATRPPCSARCGTPCRLIASRRSPFRQ